MMGRYNQPPQIQGRLLSPLVESKGKRHYWGLKGKNYGFYTTNDEIDMEERYRLNRKLKSQQANYMTIPHQSYQNRRINTEPIQRIQRDQKDQRNAIEQSQSLGRSALQRQQSNPETIDMPKQMQLQGLCRGNNERMQRSRQLGLSHIVDISLQPKNIRLPEIKRTSLPNDYNTIDQSRINGSKLEPNKGNVVYYTRRDRSLNPTFCNSLAYPLPCYKYIA